MSRTDVHRPGWVQERDPTMAGSFEPRHFHYERDWDPIAREWVDQHVVPCDLGEYLAAKGRPRTRCGHRYVGGRHILCGCGGCTGQAGRKYRRRQERAQWRATRRLLLTGGELP